MNTDFLHKFKKLLPAGFPTRRFEHLSQKLHLKTDPNLAGTCNYEEKEKYETAILYKYRSQIYPMFPDSLRTLDQIAADHRKEAVMLTQLEKFKQIIVKEKAAFAAFASDCSMLQELSGQVKLLEKHLKIEQQPRQPANTKTAISRLYKNASRQLDFARKHFQINEKLFLSKWKIFFEFESEKILCPF